MSAVVGWAMAALAFAIGFARWGWPGAVLGFTIIAFWMLLQFSRALRVMRRAAAAPVGHVASAVMLHARLERGMKLLDILPLSGSLGRRLAEDPETFEWTDPGGDRVIVELVNGRSTSTRLVRSEAAAAGS
jgi:hypothetical protein